MCQFFARLDKNTNCWENLRNCRKFSKDFLRKLKMNYFSIFFKKCNKPCVNFFSWLDEKHTSQEMLQKFLKIFAKKFNRKLEFFTIMSLLAASLLKIVHQSPTRENITDLLKFCLTIIKLTLYCKSTCPSFRQQLAHDSGIR